MVEYLSKKEVAARLGISYRTLTEWMADHRIPYFKVGVTVRFEWADVQRTLEKNNRVAVKE